MNKAGTEFNENGWVSSHCAGVTPLNLAVGNLCDEAVKVLIQAGADVNKGSEYGMTPLMEALEDCANDMFRDKRINCTKLLLEAGTDVNIEYRGKTALHLASRHGLHETVDLLIQAGADVNKGGEGGCVTPLIEASRCSASVSRRVKC